MSGRELDAGALVWVELAPGVLAEAEVVGITATGANLRYTHRMRWRNEAGFLGRAHFDSHPPHGWAE